MTEKKKSKIESELLEKINIVSNLIHEKSLRGDADYIIVSPKVAEAIENLDIKKLRKKKLEQILKKRD